MTDDLKIHIQIRLDACRRVYEGGNKGAILDVLAICYEYHVNVPSWALPELIVIVRVVLMGTSNKQEGRHAKWINRYRDDMKDFERAETVRICRENGISSVNVYAAAELYLEGRFAAGSEDTIKKSCTRFNKRSKVEPARYHILKSAVFIDDAQPISEENWRQIEMMKTKGN